MKYTFLIRMMGMLLFLVYHAFSLSAQCPNDVIMTATVTHSIGPSDGAFQITTNVVGATANEVTYVFEAIPLTPGASHPAPTDNPVINNLAPGRYNLLMKATCVNDYSKVISKTLTNLVVNGSYTLPSITESKLTRGSFDTCPTGIIAVNVKNGGSTFTCTLKNAPSGVSLGLVSFSTQPGTNGSQDFVLNGSYPAGTYKLDIRDQYGKGREMDITLAQLTQSNLPTIVPPATWVHERFTPAQDCDHISFNYLGLYTSQFSNEDFKKYYEQGEFEMAIAPTGETPHLWQKIIVPSPYSPAQHFDLTPYSLQDLHIKGLSVFVRLKNCIGINNECRIKLRKPIFEQSGSQSYCEKYGWNIYYEKFPFYRLWCYPVTLTLHENDKTGAVKGTYTITSATDKVTIPVDYNKKWYVEANDGTNTWEATTIPERFVDYVKLPRQTFCNHWRKFYNLNTFSACLPLVVKIERESDNYAQSVQTINSVTDFNYFGPTEERGYDKVSNPLEYGVDYRLKVYKADGTTLLWTAPTTFRQDVYSNKVQFSLWNPSPCGKHLGSMFLLFGEDGKEPPLRDAAGKMMMSYRMLDSQGKEIPGTFFTYTSYDGTTFSTTTTSMPPGTYILEETNLSLPIGDPCRVRQLSTTWDGMFDVKQFTYTSTTDCGKLQLKPQGKIIYKGVPYNDNKDTKFSIISGVIGGYSPNFRVKVGDVIELTQPGDYILGIGNDRLTSNCYLDTLHVHVLPLNFEVSRAHLKAYSCMNTLSSVGHIEVKGVKGKAPITYELREMDGVTVVKSAPDDISADGVAHFVAGVTGDQFMVYAKDACGLYFLEPVTVVSARGMRFLPSSAIRACPHSTIRLQSTYELDTYEWRAPDGRIISTEHTFDIVDAQTSQSGRYHFTTKLRNCDYKLEADVDVLIQPCEVLVNPHLVSPVVH
jgi:hypothetical protein